MNTEIPKIKTHVDTQYLNLMQEIRDTGVVKTDRTGTGTKSIFGTQMRFNLSEGLPLLTTKRVFFKGVIIELIWFLNGNTNIKFLTDNGVHIWDQWADENGDLGRVYGAQWRGWKGANGETIDQMAVAMDKIRNKPDDRRIIVNSFKVDELDQMKLPPCHCLFQFWVGDGKLSCHLYQRSCDFLLGVPFNIASYAMLTMMVAHCTGLEPGDFIWTGGDTHLYSNHTEQVDLQLSRRSDIRPMPTVKINPEAKDIFGFKYEDFTLEGYNPHTSIKAPIAV